MNDDTSAIQAALTAAASSGGGIVFLPGGAFVCGTVGVASDNVTLKGEGKGVTTLLLGTSLSGPRGILFGDGTTQYRHCCLQSLTIDATNVGALTASVEFNLQSQIRCEDVQFIAGATQLLLLGVSEPRVAFCEHLNPAEYAIDLHGDGGTEAYLEDISVQRTMSGTTAAGIRIVRTTTVDTGGVYMVRVKVTRPGSHGTIVNGLLVTSSATTPQFIFMDQCVFDNVNGGDAAAFESITDIRINSSYFTYVGGSSGNAISFTDCEGIVVANSYMVGVGAHDLGIYGSTSNFQARLNIFSGSGTNVYLDGSGFSGLDFRGGNFFGNGTLTNNDAAFLANVPLTPGGLGHLGVSDIIGAPTGGSIVGKIALYDPSSAIVGYLPIYAS